MHYPPKGTRGVGLARAQGYGASFAEYRKELDTETILIAQIEHIDGVDNIEAILAVEEVDGIMIGPYDLSASLGIPGDFEAPRFKESIDKIERLTKKSGKALGTHIVEPDTERLSQCVKNGYTFIAYTLDIRILDSNLRHGVEVFKSAI